MIIKKYFNTSIANRIKFYICYGSRNKLITSEIFNEMEWMRMVPYSAIGTEQLKKKEEKPLKFEL